MYAAGVCSRLTHSNNWAAIAVTKELLLSMTIFIIAPVTHWSVKLALTALSKPFVEPNLLDYRPIDWVAHAMVAFLHFLDGQAFSLGIDRNAERNLKRARTSR